MQNNGYCINNNNYDQDQICDDSDPDDDNDGSLDDDDIDDNNEYICEDSDGDSCDECATGTYLDIDLDGTDFDGDGACDEGVLNAHARCGYTPASSRYRRVPRVLGQREDRRSTPIDGWQKNVATYADARRARDLAASPKPAPVAE